MALPTHGNFQLAPYIFEEDLDNISIPDCVSAPETINTEEEFNDYIEANGYFMIGTYVDTWSGSSQFNKAGCPPEEPGTYEDVWANFIIAFPDSPNPRYRISSLLKDDGTRMAEVWHSGGDFGENPCGDFGPTFSEECYKDEYGNDRTLYGGAFVTSISIYRQIAGFTCPPNSHYENGECVPNQGWKWCFEGYHYLCPVDPGIPDGPILRPPTVVDPDRTDPENPTCPTCYEYDSVQDVCIYVGGEGCEEEVPCVKTASCDDELLITGNCIDRNEC